MTRVITYGTFDLLHYGHIRLLERAKQLGDYLIVGITADAFDRTRGKINVKQSLMERVEAVRATGIADEIIIEEYEGQKIDDIRRLNVDIFTVGSDWIGVFDYLNEFCKVVYLDRTEGVSSSELRAQKREIRLGLVGTGNVLVKYYKESQYVNGISVTAICTDDPESKEKLASSGIRFDEKYEDLLNQVDAVYIISHPKKHYAQIKQALEQGKHVLCESPITLDEQECKALFELAKEKNLVLMDAMKTAYSTAYSRLLLLVKSGLIGKVVSIDATCTSLLKTDVQEVPDTEKVWNSICAWGPTTMLPIFQLLGPNYSEKRMISKFLNREEHFDLFTKIDFLYPDAVASMKVGKGVKSEGELVISGTEGYIYVPAPWWKTDYFEVRFENIEENKRYFYALDGEGIRYELVAFAKAIETGKETAYISENVSVEIAHVIEDFMVEKDMHIIR